MKLEGKRMMMRKMWTGWSIGMVAWLLLLAVSVRGDVKVTNIEVKPRYPWNGLVDIVYSINWNEVDLNGEPFEVRVEFEGYDTVLDKTFVMKSMSGDGVNAPITRDPDKTGGTYKATWNAAKDYPTINTAAFKVKIHASVPLYMVVDLSEGPDANSYPVRYTGEAPNLDDDTCRTTELWLRRISPGKFTMGSPAEEMGRSDDELQHEVTITKSFYIGVFECTQKQWQLVTRGNPSYYKNDLNPVERINHDTTKEFLNTLKNKTGLAFDLPTEAQWEYACRAGTTTAFNSGKDLTNPNGADSALNEVGNGGGYNTDSKVGSYKPNAWGLYDMHGNVWEWCLDWYDSEYYSVSPAEDPAGPTTGSARVIRGGSSHSQASKDCRSAKRSNNNPNGYYGSSDYLGFRVFCRP
jgi:formylglycine-generating enzyme required for sulfatase activity